MNKKQIYLKKGMFFLFITTGILLLLFVTGCITKDALFVRCGLLLSGTLILIFLPEQVFIKIKGYTKYEELLDTELMARAPILRFEYPSYLLLGISFLFYFVSPMSTIAVFSITLNSFICLILSGYSLYVFYILNKEKKKKSPFSTGQKGFFPGEAIAGKNIVFVCKKCLQMGLPAVMFFGAGVPKIIYGFTYRPPLFNAIGYPFTNVTSNNEVCYGTALDLIDKEPDLLNKITLDDGHTVTWESLMRGLDELDTSPKSVALKAWAESLKK